MKKINLPLVIGGTIIFAIIIVILFPSMFTSINPYVIEGVKSTVQKNGSLVVKGAPFPPSSKNILGTDVLGRDIFSLIIYGTRLTIELGILIVLGRFVVALPIGMAAGFGNSVCKSIIRIFNILFSAIPALIISILILRLSFFLGLFKEGSIIAFVGVLTFVGWARLAEVIKERVENILAEPFIKGERAIGKSGLKIAMDNVLPHLSPEFTILFFMETSLALSMIMQLGFFGIYVGNLRVVSDTDSNPMQTMNISYEPEWASMLATSINYIKSEPLTVLSPAVAFFISIFGFNVFGEALREKLQSKNSKFIVNFRNVMTFRFITKKLVRNTLAFLCAIFIITNCINGLSAYKNSTSDKNADKIVNWNFKDQVLVGSNEAQYTADNLKVSLEKCGFKPIGKDYIQNYNIDRQLSVDKYSFSVESSGSRKQFILGKDFSFNSFGNYELNGKLFDAAEADILSIKDYSIFDNKFVVVDEAVYTRNLIENFENKLKQNSKYLGVIDVIKKEDKLPACIGSNENSKPFLFVTQEMKKYIKQDENVVLSANCNILSGEGKNVIGILKGNNEKLNKEAIIIGMGYNYLACDKADTENRIKMAIQLAKRLKDNSRTQGRSIIIAFWDGNVSDNQTGIEQYVKNPIYPLENTVLNINLTYVNPKDNSLLYNSQQVPVTKYFSWTFNHQLEVNLKDNKLKVEDVKNKKTVTEILKDGPNADEIMYYKGAIPTIITYSQNDVNVNKKAAIKSKFVDILYSTISNNNY